jgi:hypothetical protein
MQNKKQALAPCHFTHAYPGFLLHILRQGSETATKPPPSRGFSAIQSLSIAFWARFPAACGKVRTLPQAAGNRCVKKANAFLGVKIKFPHQIACILRRL